jgi:hypothetical protein
MPALLWRPPSFCGVSPGGERPERARRLPSDRIVSSPCAPQCGRMARSSAGQQPGPRHRGLHGGDHTAAAVARTAPDVRWWSPAGGRVTSNPSCRWTLLAGVRRADARFLVLDWESDGGNGLPSIRTSLPAWSAPHATAGSAMSPWGVCVPKRPASVSALAPRRTRPAAARAFSWRPGESGAPRGQNLMSSSNRCGHP